MTGPARCPALVWHVYVLRCGDDSLYTGIAVDLNKRLQAHLAGKGSRYVRSRKKFTLIHEEIFPDRSSALKREAAIKRLSRRKKLLLIRSAVRSV